MPTFEIVEGREFHCGQMARIIRRSHQTAMATLGMNAHRDMRAYFDDSSYRRALLIDGELAVVGGVRGPAISTEGLVWIAVAERATKYPRQLIGICRAQLEFVLTIKWSLMTFVFPEDETSLRFAKFMGFQTIRNANVDRGEGGIIPMIIRRPGKIPYSADEIHQVLH